VICPQPNCYLSTLTLDTLNNSGISQDDKGKIIHVSLQQLALSTEGNNQQTKRGDHLTAGEI
jgi:hypothetical protein